MDDGTDNRRGIDLVRRLDEDERRLLRNVFETTRERTPGGLGVIHWVNLYLNRAFTQDHPARRELHEWLTRTVAHIYAAWSEAHILAYGFVINPAGNPNNQPFHCDYSGTSSNLFVPLTRISLLNAVQFIRQPLTRARMDHKYEYGSVEDILAAEGCDGIEVLQLICQPYSLLRLLPNTPHRGIANGDDYDRVMFFATVDDHYHALEETPFFKYSTREHGPIPERRAP